MDDHRKLSAAPPVQMEAVAPVGYVTQWGLDRLREGVLGDGTVIAIRSEPKDECKFPLYASPVPSSERDNIIEMCARVAKQYALRAEQRAGQHLQESAALAAALDKFEAATEIEAAIRSLKSQPAQESGEGSP